MADVDTSDTFINQIKILLSRRNMAGWLNKVSHWVSHFWGNKKSTPQIST